MSVAEKKVLAFEKLAALQTEPEIDEILGYLEKLNASQTKNDQVAKHANSIMSERVTVLEKLAK